MSHIFMYVHRSSFIVPEQTNTRQCPRKVMCHGEIAWIARFSWSAKFGTWINSVEPFTTCTIAIIILQVFRSSTQFTRISVIVDVKNDENDWRPCENDIFGIDLSVLFERSAFPWKMDAIFGTLPNAHLPLAIKLNDCVENRKTDSSRMDFCTISKHC